jgi:NCS1 family nucleobase:cation symporter-1
MKKWNVLVYLKVFSFCVSSAALLAWTITAAGGTGYVYTSMSVYRPLILRLYRAVVLQQSTLSGSARAWGIVRMILTSAAGCSTFASNASDFQRMVSTWPTLSVCSFSFFAPIRPPYSLVTNDCC